MKNITIGWAATLFLYANVSVAGGWVEDWVTSYSSSSPGFYEGSERGYVSFGSVSARWPVTTEFPITVSPPRLNAGCGGIDAYWGGFSYIKDPEWLVKKAEGMLKNAAFISFDLAIKNMCQPCSDAMATAENLSNFLNGININECSMAKKMVVTRGPDDPSVWSDMANEVTQGQSLSPTGGVAKNPSDYNSQRDALDGKSPVDMSNAMNACPLEFRQIYSGGSVVKNIVTKVNMLPYYEVLRAFTGDIIVSYDAGANLYNFQPYEVCPQNRAVDLDAFVYGMVQKRREADNKCITDVGDPLIVTVRGHLQDVLDGYADPTKTIPVAAKSMLNSVPIPVASSLKTALMRGSGNVAVNILAEPVSIMLAGQSIEDLFERTDALVRFGLKASKLRGAAAGANPKDCKRELVEPATEFLRKLRERMWDMRKQSKQQVIAKLQEMQVSASVARNEAESYRNTQLDTRQNIMTNR